MGSSVESPTDLIGPAIIYTVTSKQVRTFDEYGDQVFLPWINQQLLQNCNRVDIIWDRYISDSLKESIREKRGKGIYEEKYKVIQSCQQILQTFYVTP